MKWPGKKPLKIHSQMRCKLFTVPRLFTASSVSAHEMIHRQISKYRTNLLVLLQFSFLPSDNLDFASFKWKKKILVDSPAAMLSPPCSPLPAPNSSSTDFWDPCRWQLIINSSPVGGVPKRRLLMALDLWPTRLALLLFDSGWDGQTADTVPTPHRRRRTNKQTVPHASAERPGVRDKEQVDAFLFQRKPRRTCTFTAEQWLWVK